MRHPRLSICIPSLVKREESREALLAAIAAQPLSRDVELLTAIDEGEETTGKKRNDLVARAAGDYIVHVDDDDMVATNYLEKVFEALDEYMLRGGQAPDVVLLRIKRTVGPPKPRCQPVFYDFEVGRAPYFDGHVFWQSPNHICPLRADLAKAIPFQEWTLGEDVEWTGRARPFIRTWARAGKPSESLYHYQWNPAKKLTPSALRARPKSRVLDAVRRRSHSGDTRTTDDEP